MKQTLAILALAGLVAWPAAGEAAGKKKKVRHKPAPVVQQRHAPSWVYRPEYRGLHSHNPAWDVYRPDGSYGGSDPDPLVRDVLRRPPSRE